MAFKRRRNQAICAKAIVNPKIPKAAMAITPATNVACMKYNGGGKAETICMIDLGNPDAMSVRHKKKPITIKGISSIHYMEAEAGGVRVWHVANIGPGRLVTWTEIQKHHHGNKVVDPKVPLIHVPAAIDPHRLEDDRKRVPSKEFDAKIHRSHRNVKARKKLRELRVQEKARDRENKYQESVRELTRKYEEVKSLR